MAVRASSRACKRRLIGVLAMSVLIAVAGIEIGRLHVGTYGSSAYPGITTIDFPACPTTTVQRRGFQARALDRGNRGGTWDLRGAVWDDLTFPVRSESWSRGCVRGGVVHGPIARAASRDEWYDGVGGGEVGGEGLRITMPGSADGWLSVRDMFIEDIEDAYDPNAGGAAARTYLNHVRARYIRDDCIENEQRVHNIYVNNSFFDGCFTAFAERPSGARSARRGKTPVDFIVENSLVYVQPQALGPNYCNRASVARGRCVAKGDAWLGSYGIWKWSDKAAANVEIRSTIFRLDMPSYSSCRSQQWPRGSYEDVTLVWMGRGPYRSAGGCENTVPSGVTVTNDESVWDKAVNAWLHQ